MRLATLAFLSSWIIVGHEVHAQQSTSFAVPRTEFGHPDFQGVWGINFVTLMERPADNTSLADEPTHAKTIARDIQNGFRECNTDPEFLWTGDMELAQVNGEFRSSLIIRPDNGRIPFSESGKALALERTRLDKEGFDGPEKRELSERCLAGLGGPPAGVLPLILPRMIVQTQNHVVIYMEDVAGLRVIALDDTPPESLARRFEGDSRGHWEGDTLVVETNHFRYDYPVRILSTNYIFLDDDTRVTERLTRISAREILYQFTVEDDDLYTEPWSGEYPLSWMDGHSYIYECHEGNYSLPGILRGGQVESR